MAKEEEAKDLYSALCFLSCNAGGSTGALNADLICDWAVEYVTNLSQTDLLRLNEFARAYKTMERIVSGREAEEAVHCSDNNVSHTTVVHQCHEMSGTLGAPIAKGEHQELR